MTDEEDRDIVRDKLYSLAQPDVVPVIEQSTVDEILDRHQIAQRWSAEAEVEYGQYVLPSTRNGHRYMVTTGGDLGDAEPTWPTDAEYTVTSGAVTLQEAGSDSASAYDLRSAVREVWAMKAAKASEFINSEDGNEQAIYEHCQRQQKNYAYVGVA